MKHWGSGNAGVRKQKAGRLKETTHEEFFIVLVMLRRGTNVKEVSHLFGVF